MIQTLKHCTTNDKIHFVSYSYSFNWETEARKSTVYCFTVSPPAPYAHPLAGPSVLLVGRAPSTEVTSAFSFSHHHLFLICTYIQSLTIPTNTSDTSCYFYCHFRLFWTLSLLQQCSNRVFCPVFLPLQFKPPSDQTLQSTVPTSPIKTLVTLPIVVLHIS